MWFWLIGALMAGGADPPTYTVKLNINANAASFAGTAAALEPTEDGSLRKGKLPGGVPVEVRALKGSTEGWLVKIDGGDPGEIALLPGETAIVTIPRKRDGSEPARLPYRLRYDRDVRQGQVSETLFVLPGYRAEGKLRVGVCSALLVALDLNGDGVFDDKDFKMGTNIGVDFNDDGRIWGPDEWRKGTEVIEFCGVRLEAAGMAPDGGSITFRQSNLRVPRLGETVPEFTMPTMEGAILRTSEMRGKVHLLDFWASWCAPCVTKLPDVRDLAREFGDRLQVIGIDVDEPTRIEEAQKIIRKLNLPFPHVARGLGEADPLWKTFGGMEGNRLAIPLYVLLDREGQIRYAGNGGENLAELRAWLRRLAE